MESKQNKNWLKIAILILIPASFISYWLVSYCVANNKPESLRVGIELLENNKDIIAKIGSNTSYSYYKKDEPKDTDNPASFKVSMEGYLATIYLSCTMKKNNSGEWKLVFIKQDSLKRK